MQIVLSVIAFIVVLSVIAILHEFGHFLTARGFGVEVEEFGLGFPPKLARLFTWKGTEFTLNAIPFGAFVRPKGESDPNDKSGLLARSPWVRLSVLLAGPLSNVVVGWLLFSILFALVGAPNTQVIQVIDVSANSPAQAAGLTAGDQIVAVDGQTISSTSQLSSIISQHLGEPLVISVVRNGKVTDVQVTPRAQPPANQGPVGIVMGNPIETINLFQAVPYSGRYVGMVIKQFFVLPVQLITGQIQPQGRVLVGPVGLFSIFNQAVEPTTSAAGPGTAAPTPIWINLLSLVANLFVLIGLTNLLPIPGLDGGQIFLLIPELVSGKAIPFRLQSAIQMLGLAFLLLLMVYVTFNDITNPIVLP